MKKLEFQDLKFADKGDKVRCIFLQNYYFDIPKSELGSLEVKEGALWLEDRQAKRFDHILEGGFSNLTNMINGRRTVYVHKNSGIPLMGSNYFGLIDRNTNLIEVRPNTGCNLDCIYCSVNEGRKSGVDYVVEKDYLVQELKRLIAQKGCDDIEAHIGPQGEPLLYSPLADLIRDIRAIPEVKRISIDTNGILLSKDRIRALLEAGLTQINLSVNSLDKELACRIANRNYSVKHMRQVIEDIAKEDVRLVIAPVWLQGINDKDVEDMISLSKTLGADIGVQNFLEYKRGKRPVKAISMEDFYAKLSILEKKHKIRLILNEKDFSIQKTRKAKQVFRKGETVELEIVCDGRLNNEVLARARDRIVHVRGVLAGESGRIKAKITRIKHNIYYSVKI